MKTDNVISNRALTTLLNKSIGILLKDFLKIALSDFSSVKSILKIASKQKKSENIRKKYEDIGIHVPPFFIASITSTCNLKCKGCYDREKVHSCESELEENKWSDIFLQARDLGVSFILLAGGEPLIKEKIIKECINYPEIIFPIFTNGLLINEKWVDFFASTRNAIPIISLEGNKLLTDDRRGAGVYDIISKNMDLLKKKQIFYGSSITLTSENFHVVLQENHIKKLLDKGCRLFFIIEYVPFDETTKSLVISNEQREQIEIILNRFRNKYNGLFIAFPGDERIFGGCLAAGRGFIHINSSGAVEACPFAPYSDMSLNELSLKDTFASPLLEKIRNLNSILDHSGGCSLFENKKIVEKAINIE